MSYARPELRKVFHMTRIEDFWQKVEKTDTCWNWKACKDRYGYGRLGHHGTSVLAHRISYELIKGMIPNGLTIDHLCKNRACVNPDHMEVVTNEVNVQRGESYQAKQTHCKRGHPLSGSNLISYRGSRGCRECKRVDCRNYYQRNRIKILQRQKRSGKA